MIVKIPSAISAHTGRRLSIRCPACGNRGTFEPIQTILDIALPNLSLGQRKCPNLDCQAHIFCIYDNTGNVLRTYPAQRIDFDPKSIPPKIVETFTEALSCDAENLHVASAIMIRRTLEELCEDKGATGNTLKDRIGSLRSTVVLPEELFKALDELRLLGNDAAHINAKTYDSIGPDEIEVAILLTKEILKAVYQLDDLLSRLIALKKP